MKIFDAHVHVEKGMDKFDLDNIEKNLICNELNLLPIYKQALNENDTLSLIFDFRNKENILQVKDFIASQQISALKIHSRIQKIFIHEYPLLISELKGIDDKIPVILDAWYYGHDYAHLPSLEQNINIITGCPNKKFIIAHSGGYELLKYFFHLRDLKNVFYDLSLSLQYFHDSSIFTDLKKIIKWIPHQKLIFGSDYPWGSPAFQFSILFNILKELGFPGDSIEDVLYNNAVNLYRNNK